MHVLDLFFIFVQLLGSVRLPSHSEELLVHAVEEVLRQDQLVTGLFNDGLLFVLVGLNLLKHRHGVLSDRCVELLAQLSQLHPLHQEV